MDDTSQSESNLSAAGTHVPYGMDTHGAPLSPAVTVRFERLLDRINLYALPEIQECLDEKDGLVFLVGPQASSESPSTNMHILRISTSSP